MFKKCDFFFFFKKIKLNSLILYLLSYLTLLMIRNIRFFSIFFIQTKFSEMILPLLVHDLLQQCQPIHKEILSSHIRRFFSLHCEQESCTSRSNSSMSISSRGLYDQIFSSSFWATTKNCFKDKLNPEVIETKVSHY